MYGDFIELFYLLFEKGQIKEFLCFYLSIVVRRTLLCELWHFPHANNGEYDSHSKWSLSSSEAWQPTVNVMNGVESGIFNFKNVFLCILYEL